MPLYSTGLRYLPHLDSGEVLRMGLRQQAASAWIETDRDILRYHKHKRQLQEACFDRVFRAEPDSLPARQELSRLLLKHLVDDQADIYQLKGDSLRCIAGDFASPYDAGEPLWECSLWIADDLVLMQERNGKYHLSAASLCSPSHWSLQEKFGRPLAEIHDPIPGFHARLTPRVDRYFAQLRPGPVNVRFNWSVQAGDELAQFPGGKEGGHPGAALYYRVERQTLRRLPESGAVVFTIRVYLHPLEDLLAFEGALQALLATIDTLPETLAHYKGIDSLYPALEKYRNPGA